MICFPCLVSSDFAKQVEKKDVPSKQEYADCMTILKPLS